MPVHVNVGGFVKAIQAEFETFEKKMKKKNKKCLKEIESIKKIVEKHAKEIKELRELLECDGVVCRGKPKMTTPTDPTAPKFETCADLDCKNKGVCEESDGSAKCLCKKGYFGDECEGETLCSEDVPHNRARKNMEKRVKCKNGGWCMDKTGHYWEKESSYLCECPPGFYGDLCENGQTPIYSDYEM